MQKYVALLRGINVGGRNIKMSDLKAQFELMGFTDVVTILQTGNVIFASDNGNVVQVKDQIESGLQSKFNYPAIVFVYDIDALKKIITDSPYADPGDEWHHYIVLTSGDLVAEFTELPAFDPNMESVTLGKDVIYWLVRKGHSLDSAFAKILAKAKHKERNTVRNINTMRKIVAK